MCFASDRWQILEIINNRSSGRAGDQVHTFESWELIDSSTNRYTGPIMTTVTTVTVVVAVADTAVNADIIAPRH